jgi:hypothetical protein
MVSGKLAMRLLATGPLACPHAPSITTFSGVFTLLNEQDAQEDGGEEEDEVNEHGMPV